MCKCEVYLQYQWHPDKKHHESIKHTPAILNIGIIPLYKEKQRATQSKTVKEKDLTIYRFQKAKERKCARPLFG